MKRFIYTSALAISLFCSCETGVEEWTPQGFKLILTINILSVRYQYGIITINILQYFNSSHII